MAEMIFANLIFNLLVIAFSFVILNLASNIAINNSVKVANITRLGKTAIGFSLIAFSTSLPELTVAFIAAFSGGAALSVGNILGSNIVNITLVVGLAAVLVCLNSLRKVRKNKSEPKTCLVPPFAKSELSSIHFGLFISSLIPMILIYINTASWIVGLILISIFIAYMYQLSHIRIPTEGEPVSKKEKDKLRHYIGLSVLGALGVVGSAYFLVESAVTIARGIGVPQTVIGATIIALGTSLPEITMGLKAFLQGHPGLAFGDIIGSSFVNITLILGVTLFVPTLIGAPISMNIGVFQNLVIFSIITNLFFWYFISREEIGWKEGAVFIFIYGLFLATTLGLI